jgi:hypothetical protein
MHDGCGRVGVRFSAGGVVLIDWRVTLEAEAFREEGPFHEEGGVTDSTGWDR